MKVEAEFAFNYSRNCEKIWYEYDFLIRFRSFKKIYIWSEMIKSEYDENIFKARIDYGNRNSQNDVIISNMCNSLVHQFS